MEKLSRALDEVDQKVASLRHRFETLTKEAAELKIKLDKENETIQAAEMLVSKLDGEYQRWSSQVCCKSFCWYQFSWTRRMRLYRQLRRWCLNWTGSTRDEAARYVAYLIVGTNLVRQGE